MSERAKKQVGVISAYQKVFNSTEGKLVLDDLMKTHHIMTSTFSGKNSDEVLFREGERNTVLRIMTLLKMDGTLLNERIANELND